MCSRADISGDGSVDIGDYTLWADNFGSTECNETNAWCNGADTTRDGIVNDDDYYLWAVYYTEPCGAVEEVTCELDLCSRADISGDGSVDIGDYTLWADNFGSTDCNETNAWCNGADLSRNGEVTDNDYYFWAIYYGDNCSASGTEDPALTVTAECNDTDFDLDGKVDMADFIAFREIFNSDNTNDTTNCSADNNWCNRADIDKDGNVTDTDLALFTSNFGMTCPVQEPVIPVVIITSGGGGGGSSSGGCIINWSCGEWDSCSNGTQLRSCIDENRCGTLAERPDLSQSCNESSSLDLQQAFSSEEPEGLIGRALAAITGAVVGSGETSGLRIAGYFIILILIGTGAVIIFRKVKKKK
ncbi:hypothetical protein HN499_00910 [archaeon]|nr:hypothetical protein [archaeon]